MKTTRRGILTLSPDQLDLALDNAAGSGFRTETHCIGDAALDMILGGLERRLAKELAAKRYRLTSALYRPVLTHVQIASRDLFRRIANLSDALGKRGSGPVICNVQVGQADFTNAESDLSQNSTFAFVNGSLIQSTSGSNPPVPLIPFSRNSSSLTCLWWRGRSARRGQRRATPGSRSGTRGGPFSSEGATRQ